MRVHEACLATGFVGDSFVVMKRPLAFGCLRWNRKRTPARVNKRDGDGL